MAETALTNLTSVCEAILVTTDPSGDFLLDSAAKNMLRCYQEGFLLSLPAWHSALSPANPPLSDLGLFKIDWIDSIAISEFREAGLLPSWGEEMDTEDNARARKDAIATSDKDHTATVRPIKSTRTSKDATRESPDNGHRKGAGLAPRPDSLHLSQADRTAHAQARISEVEGTPPSTEPNRQAQAGSSLSQHELARGLSILANVAEAFDLARDGV